MRWNYTRCISSLQLKPLGNLQPTTATNDHQETILLYRALLRQCTYLPDSAARNYMWSHVRDRFQDYQPLARGENGRVRRKINQKEPKRALKYARKSLKYLQRADDGHLNQLRTVLNMTYGRIGKRSRLLMTTIQTPNTIVDDAALAELSQQISKDPVRKKKVPKLTDEALALVKSQKKQDSSRFNRGPLRSTEPNMPAVNIWGRPFPQKRKANFIRRWYADTMWRLMPPLPGSEWDRLQGLAIGTTPWDGPVPRRKLGTSSAQALEDTSTLFAPIDSPHRLTSSTERVVVHGRHRETRTNPHRLTPRLMRRLWSKVFQACPRLDWSSERNKWMVTWGHKGKKADLVLNAQKKLPPEMFDGVDEDGEVF